MKPNRAPAMAGARKGLVPYRRGPMEQMETQEHRKYDMSIGKNTTPSAWCMDTMFAPGWLPMA